MPELAEVKIMSGYINQSSKNKIFDKLYHVGKGNVTTDDMIGDKFTVGTVPFGKELQLKLKLPNKWEYKNKL